jgi:hypothetical protein
MPRQVGKDNIRHSLKWNHSDLGRDREAPEKEAPVMTRNYCMKGEFRIIMSFIKLHEKDKAWKS